MHKNSWVQRLTTGFANQRRRLSSLAIPVLTAAALSGSVATPLIVGIIITQMLVLLWATDVSGTQFSLARDRRKVVAVQRDALEAGFANIAPGSQSAALAIRLDDAERLKTQHGARFIEALVAAMGARLAGTLREQDSYCPLDKTSFGAALFPQRGIDLGSVLTVAQRIQTTLAQPFKMEDVTIWPSVSIGFCLSQRAASLNGIGMLQAAEQAAFKAQAAGPGNLRSYSVVDFPAAITGERLEALQRALENGEICPHFQPQVLTTTGQISGLEALARWNHPQRGLVPPSDFIPLIEAGLSSKLAETMLRGALKTLAALEGSGQHVPSVSVNLSAEELRNPRLADEITWELDRHNLTPERLTIEILETVVADSDDDIAVRNIARLAGMGCGIDLDDFGTGHASIANIRRFAVGRIKIDRSFVTRMHEDRDQQRMVAAILSMSQQLELETVAEGVECAEEQIMLAQMGCNHLQGFAIARPMPAETLGDWLHAHEAALSCGEPWCEETTPARTASNAPH
ncbi:bifunctional diguanylate cyclase/phosphodiesterase [Pararhodobacter sp.]|uniref:putative bifunctional diguanylate cyclase/phosphodiesterase n=1 Tax=Pararhodobacter sp. TaxID=2127056 RepID=UPI002AFFF7F5|nr:bifunctional diguanylate cyclase/phosphodiesterase [Pararhodobacter sp.]